MDERTCQYRLAHTGGPCGAPLAAGGHACAEHAGLECCVCGAAATHECPHAAQFVCGCPLCDGCEGYEPRAQFPRLHRSPNHSHRAKPIDGEVVGGTAIARQPAAATVAHGIGGVAGGASEHFAEQVRVLREQRDALLAACRAAVEHFEMPMDLRVANYSWRLDVLPQLRAAIATAEAPRGAEGRHSRRLAALAGRRW